MDLGLHRGDMKISLDLQFSDTMKGIQLKLSDTKVKSKFLVSDASERRQELSRLLKRAFDNNIEDFEKLISSVNFLWKELMKYIDERVTRLLIQLDVKLEHKFEAKTVEDRSTQVEQEFQDLKTDISSCKDVKGEAKVGLKHGANVTIGDANVVKSGTRRDDIQDKTNSAVTGARRTISGEITAMDNGLEVTGSGVKKDDIDNRTKQRAVEVDNNTEDAIKVVEKNSPGDNSESHDYKTAEKIEETPGDPEDMSTREEKKDRVIEGGSNTEDHYEERRTDFMRKVPGKGESLEDSHGKETTEKSSTIVEAKVKSRSGQTVESVRNDSGNHSIQENSDGNEDDSILDATDDILDEFDNETDRKIDDDVKCDRDVSENVGERKKAEDDVKDDDNVCENGEEGKYSNDRSGCDNEDISDDVNEDLSSCNACVDNSTDDVNIRSEAEEEANTSEDKIEVEDGTDCFKMSEEDHSDSLEIGQDQTAEQEDCESKSNSNTNEHRFGSKTSPSQSKFAKDKDDKSDVATRMNNKLTHVKQKCAGLAIFTKRKLLSYLSLYIDKLKDVIVRTKKYEGLGLEFAVQDTTKALYLQLKDTEKEIRMAFIELKNALVRNLIVGDKQ